MIRTISCLVALLLAGCANIEYGKRSANEPSLPISKPPSVIVSSTVASSLQADTAPTSPTSSTDYFRVTLVNPKGKDIAAIKKGLDTPSASQKNDDSIFDTDRTVLKRTIIATVSKGDYRPADRFVNFRLRITPLNFSYSGYKGSATEYSTVNIEKLEFHTINSANAGISTKLAGGAQAGLSSQKSLTETGDVTARIEKLTVNIDNKTLDIYREAERGIDLTGNTLVNINVTAQRDKSDTQISYDTVATKIDTGKNGEYGPEKASITLALLKHLKRKNLLGHVKFDYVMRRVLEKSNEYSEHNQKIFYEKGECKQKVALIVDANDFATPRWVIVGGNNGKTALKIQSNMGFRDLHFLDPISAHHFALWMTKHKAIKIGKQQLLLPEVGTNPLNNQLKNKRYPDLAEMNVDNQNVHMQTDDQKVGKPTEFECDIKYHH